MTRDVFYAVALFLQLRAHYLMQYCGAGSLLLAPRLDAQATFAKLFADIGHYGGRGHGADPALAVGWPWVPPGLCLVVAPRSHACFLIKCARAAMRLAALHASCIEAWRVTQ